MIPIFIIVHDRVTVLKQSIDSFQTQIKYPIQIIFHDVASTYKPCLEYLEDMKSNGYMVYRSEVNNHLTIMDTIKDYLQKNTNVKYYIITDPDILLDNVNDNILQFYIWLLEEEKKKGNSYVIGPMLRIDDIPNFYPRKKLATKKHLQQFWKKKPINITWNDSIYQIQYSLIDTTFQLIDATNLSNKFPREGIRCYSPYSAKHLDWYIDPNNMEADQIYYSKHSSNISHWSNNLI